MNRHRPNLDLLSQKTFQPRRSQHRSIDFVKFLKTAFLISNLAAAFLSAPGSAFAQAKEEAAMPQVEWYPPEIERGYTPNFSRVIISGKTQPGSQIFIEGESITLLKPAAPEASKPDRNERLVRAKCRAYKSPNSNSKPVQILNPGDTVRGKEVSDAWLMAALPGGTAYVPLRCLAPLKNQSTIAPGETPTLPNRAARANGEGFFEIAMELPQGLTQMPIQITTPQKAQKVFLISVDVNVVKEDIKVTNTKVSTAKPPAAAKRIRLWAGAGFTYQTYSQTTNASPDLTFNAMQAPGMVVRGGYWGERWGIDFYFRDAPGKVQAEAPFSVQTDTYHWRTLDAKGLYQFDRGPNSRMLGLPSQWQLRFGAELQQIPFLDVDASNVVAIRDHSLTMGMLGIGLLLGQERDWSYEFALGLQSPLSSSGQAGSTFTVSSPVAYELQMGAAYKFAPGWRLGVFSYTQSVSEMYQYKANETATAKFGKQTLFYTTFDLRLGYEF
jgi:hypothetical protein